MPLPSEQHQNTTSEYTPCKTDTHRGMIKHMLGCLGKVPPDGSLFNMSDYIIQHFRELSMIPTLDVQAVNPCQRHRIRFAHPCLCHGFKACWGLCPRTPGCIPTLVLAALHPSISVSIIIIDTIMLLPLI